MAIFYGVLRGRPDRFKREDGGGSPHLQIRLLEDGGQPWRIAVNVQSNTGSHVAFWVADPLVGHPVLASLAGRPQGFTPLPPNASQALDYVKAPLFAFADGRILPPSGAASADDLQDLLSLFLEQCKAAGGEVFDFGAKFDRNLHKPIDAEFGNIDGLHGIHDIHMNQGNVGDHEQDNGVFHDGGLILKFPDRFMGLFLAFQSQHVPTDAAGFAAPGAVPLSQVLGAPAPGGTPRTPTPLVSTIYLERALINPGGPDPGRETVVLGNLSATSQTLTNWRLLDRNGRSTSISITIPAGASSIVPLDGLGVQLGNNGGNLMLQDAAGAQVDVVTYTAEDASPVDRYVRFRR
jgi:uncharacterized protein YukJ